MTQTAAIFLDAYRELHARRLFWITMVLSVLVVAVFALVGINEQGLRLIVWDVPFPLTSEIMSHETFYKLMFVNFGIEFWLTWLAAILALISTASIIPDFVSGGAIDMVLAKPIGRLRLFLTKYLTGLMFVGLQVTVFSAAAFVVIGVRGEAWEPGLFLAVPLVVLFFSYLYCVCVLVGLITRSTIAALLLTLLFWLLIFGVHTAESTLLLFKTDMQRQANVERMSIDHDRDILAAMIVSNESPAERISQYEQRIDEREAALAQRQRNANRVAVAHQITMGVKTVLPKTAETIALLERWLIDAAGIDEETLANQEQQNQPFSDESLREVADELRERSVWWIVGTSVLFQIGVLGLAGWIFVRRDF